jgi:hypothetical protein
MKDRAGGHRDLKLALTALIKLARTVKAVLSMATSRTTIALWPPKLKQVLHTGFLGAKSSLKFYQTQPLLLHRTSTSPLTWEWLVIQLRS